MSFFNNILKFAVTGACLGVLANASYASSDYGYRQINPTTSEQKVNSSEYKFVYSFAVVTEGPSGMNKRNEFDALYIALKKAHKDDKLTPEGEKFFSLIDKLYNRLRAVPQESLTELGAKQVNNIGQLYAQGRLDYIKSKADYDNNISILFSYGDDLSLRTGEQFVLGMTKALGPNYEVIFEQNFDGDTLAAYRKKDYKNYLNSNADLDKAIGRLKYDKANESLAQKNGTQRDKGVLQRIFKKELVDEITHIGLIDQVRRVKIEDKTIVEAIYDLYKILPSYDQKLAETVTNFLNDYIMRESERVYLARRENAEAFFQYGPGFIGNMITQNSGKAVEDDIGRELERFIENSSIEEAVKLYFTDHRQMLNILSFLLSDSLAPKFKASDINTLSVERSSFFNLGDLIPMNTMLVFDVYRDKSDELVLKVMLNGKDLKLRKGCFPVAEGSYFYKWSSLNDCFIHNTGL